MWRSAGSGCFVIVYDGSLGCKVIPPDGDHQGLDELLHVEHVLEPHVPAVAPALPVQGHRVLPLVLLHHPGVVPGSGAHTTLHGQFILIMNVTVNFYSTESWQGLNYPVAPVRAGVEVAVLAEGAHPPPVVGHYGLPHGGLGVQPAGGG